MIKPWTSRTSKCPKEPPKLTPLHFKIQQDSALEPLTKVLEHLKCNNFSFGRLWSSMEEMEEKAEWKQSNTKI